MQQQEMVVTATTMRRMMSLLVAIAGLVVMAWAMRCAPLWPWASGLLIGLGVNVAFHEALHTAGHQWLGHVPAHCIEATHMDGRYLGWSLPNPARLCRAVETATQFRWAVVLPGLVLGIAPLALGLALGNIWLGIVAIPGLIGARADFATVWDTRSLPGWARVLDHPMKHGLYRLPDFGLPPG